MTAPAPIPPASGDEFAVSREERDGAIVLTLAGEFDIAGVAPLAEATRAIGAGDRVFLDLREVSFMDSAGVRALMNLDLRARVEGWTIAMVGPQPRVRRVLSLCGFEDRIPILDDPLS
jgi:anti-anti-sigma factor